MKRILIIYGKESPRMTRKIQRTGQYLWALFGEEVKIYNSNTDMVFNFVSSASPFDLFVIHDGVHPNLFKELLCGMSYIPYVINHGLQVWRKQKWSDLTNERVKKLYCWNTERFAKYIQKMQK